MGWHKFLMKHGVGSPGYIAGKLAESYQLHKARAPSVEESALIRSIFVERIAAQTTVGAQRNIIFYGEIQTPLKTLLTNILTFTRLSCFLSLSNTRSWLALAPEVTRSRS